MIIDRSCFDPFIRDGFIRVQKHPECDLFIYNYTEKTQYSDNWCEETLMARGLILDGEGNVVARPWRKFFNWGERMPQPDALLVEATEKMDGSLGICFRYPGDKKVSVATRGSFVSEQAEWATDWLNMNYNTTYWPDDLTVLFEIIYPANRVVVNYGDFEGLVLIGAIDRNYGRDLLYRELEVLADGLKVAYLPRHYTLTSVKDYLDLAINLDANQEGWVLRYSNGERFKIKGDAYKVAHKLMTGVSFGRVLEAVRAGVLDQYTEGVPDEFLVTIREYETEIKAVFIETHDRVHHLFEQAPLGTRKEFAKWAMATAPEDAAYLFALLDGKELGALILKHAFKDREHA